MSYQLARELAAQAWCTDSTSHILMDTDLAEAFAKILQPFLENQYKCHIEHQFGSFDEAKGFSQCRNCTVTVPF